MQELDFDFAPGDGIIIHSGSTYTDIRVFTDVTEAGRLSQKVKLLRIIRNYFFYCGIEKDEYNTLKKDAYVSNFQVWRILHFLMAAVFGILFILSLRYELLSANRLLYLLSFLYSVIAIAFFFGLKKDSIIAQFLIYLSISLLLLLACILSLLKPDSQAVSFIAFLLVTPMFMIDKPFFMAFELSAASAVFLVWTRSVKPYDVWKVDCANVIVFTVIGIFLNVIANSIRIREFVLTRKINAQKDTDELTNLKNKGALTREINQFLADESADRGILFILDIDQFKTINDTYGHNTGDEVIRQLGSYLGEKFTGGEIVGRFGGDEFIIFIRNCNEPDTARRIAEEIIEDVPESVILADGSRKVGLSIGIAVYDGQEKNYSEIFKKADMALYRSKADPDNRYCLFGIE